VRPWRSTITFIAGSAGALAAYLGEKFALTSFTLLSPVGFEACSLVLRLSEEIGQYADMAISSDQFMKGHW
jgi:hypothetical protein